MLALPVEQLDKTLVVLQKVLGGLTRTAAAQQVCWSHGPLHQVAEDCLGKAKLGQAGLDWAGLATFISRNNKL